MNHQNQINSLQDLPPFLRNILSSLSNRIDNEREKRIQLERKVRDIQGQADRTSNLLNDFSLSILRGGSK